VVAVAGEAITMAKLAQGQPAPAFTAKTHSGKTVSMNVQRDNSLTLDSRYSVLLWFYPKASTPG